jgi:RNA polymerase sigma-70 factor (ECF subfamily)
MGQIVRNTARNWRAKHVRRNTATSEVVEFEPNPSSNQAVKQLAQQDAAVGQFEAVRDSFDDALARALDELSPVARACLLLRTTQGLAYNEISELLGVPEGTAMSHVHRARQSLRAALSPYGEQGN